ncbi:MAG TPA: CPXCG motif-containing cysteine-rich protein [Rhodanobacteraceae bacterium]|nr:CPXCG motif-containing cysteine-rich protein [Rhodanobacteraceae bacterium]
MPELVAIACPYCGEPIEIVVDDSAGDAVYVEDCPVCCRPMLVEVETNGDGVSVRVRTGDE